MEKEISDLIKRINELANKAKNDGLTEAEKVEQTALRAEYIRLYRQSLRGILDNTYIQYPDGRKVKLENKSDKK